MFRNTHVKCQQYCLPERVEITRIMFVLIPIMENFSIRVSYIYVVCCGLIDTSLQLSRSRGKWINSCDLMTIAKRACDIHQLGFGPVCGF